MLLAPELEPTEADLPTSILVPEQRTFLVVRMSFGCRPSITPHTWRRNINRYPSSTPFGPRLGTG